MLDIKRLHQVHYQYPNTARGIGKSVYCYDSLLRASQTGTYKQICYATNTLKAAKYSLNDFMQFLDDLDETYLVNEKGIITLNNTEIRFISKDDALKGGYKSYVEDYFAE